MLSTGNDIVALNAINVTRTKQPNFYSKILTPTETALYREPRFAIIPFEIFVWLLWSIKESAFKYLKRIDADILFTPVRFVVSDIQIPSGFNLLNFDKAELTGIDFDEINPVCATVKFDDHILYSNSLIYQEFVASVVNNAKDFSEISWGIKWIDSDDIEIQSFRVRAFLKNNLPNKNITVSKNQHGIPVLLKDNVEFPNPVSLSHHDKFISYSFVAL